MSNLVEITYGKLGRFPELSINGERISRYMSLSDYIYDDIFKWADIFYEIIDGELAEEYEVIVTGHPYHEIALKAFLEKSEHCKGVVIKNIEHRIPLSEKYRYIRNLRDGNEEISNCNACIVCSCDNVDNYSYFETEHLKFTKGSSVYGIASSEEEAEKLDGKYCIILSDKNTVVKKKGRTLLYTTRENLTTVADYFLNYHIYYKELEDSLAYFQNDSLNSEVKLKFEAYYYEEYRVLMTSEIPNSMSCGDSAYIDYKVFPECFPENGVYLTRSDTSVLEYENNRLVAKEQGSCVVKICDDSGKDYITKTVSVTRHIYATNITIVLPTTVMKIGDTLQFRCTLTPFDAEDINEIKYSVSDEKVAIISNPNELYAIADGRVCVTVSTPRISKKFYVTVAAEPYDLVLSSDHVKLPICAEATIFGAVVPENVDPMPSLVWQVADTNIANVKFLDANKCCIETKKYGKTVLTCRIIDTNIERQMDIHVSRTKGCYVATAVYGSYDCPQVWVLRRFRDNFLANSFFGRMFINMYYAVSPTLVKVFGKQAWFIRFTKKHLDKLVDKLIKEGYEDTSYIDE